MGPPTTTAGTFTPATRTIPAAAAPTAQDGGEFPSQKKRRKKANPSEEFRTGPSKTQSPTEWKGTAAGQWSVRNFAPLRTTEVEEDASTGKGTESEPPSPTQQQTTCKGTERAPPNH
jgi:hypothetical protein